MGNLAVAAQGRAIAPAQSQIVQFTDDNGAQVVLTAQDVLANFCGNATPTEMQIFLESCRAWRANPFLHEAYFVKFGNAPGSTVPSWRLYLKRAENHPQYNGMEFGVVVLRDGRIYQEQRTAVYSDYGEKLVGGWAKVYRKDRQVPIYVELSLKSMNKNQANWKSMPDVMIVKCAKAAALRESFPVELGTMYLEEEIGNQEVASTVTEQPAATEPAHRLANAVHQDFTEEDLAWLKDASEKLAGLGYDLNETKAYLWKVARENGISAAKSAAETMTTNATSLQTGEAVEVDAVTGEIMEDLAADDIDF